MNDYTALALVMVAAIVACCVTGFTLREFRLRRMCRRGWQQTYGITGRPADLAAQIKDLTERHDIARGVGSNVHPFPRVRSAGRAGEN